MPPPPPFMRFFGRQARTGIWRHTHENGRCEAMDDGCASDPQSTAFRDLGKQRATRLLGFPALVQTVRSGHFHVENPLLPSFERDAAPIRTGVAHAISNGCTGRHAEQGPATQIDRLRTRSFGIMVAALVASEKRRAGVAELADAPDLGSGGETREGSSPFARTILQLLKGQTTRRTFLFHPSAPGVQPSPRTSYVDIVRLSFLAV